MVEARTGRARSWSVTLGALLIILGVVALVAPLFATLTLIKLMGWVLILAAIEQAVHAFQARDEGGLFLKVLLAVLYAIVAIMLLRRPVSGAVAATVIIAILFLLDGITEIALAMRTRREGRRSGWLFLGGVMSFVFGGIILYGLPLSSLWVIGLLIGIRLIFKGIEQIVSSLPRPEADRRDELKRVA